MKKKKTDNFFAWNYMNFMRICISCLVIIFIVLVFSLSFSLCVCVCVCVSALTLDWLILAYYCQRSISKTSCRLSLPLIDPTV